MKDRLWNCINQKKTNYIPIWFMRQAGRYLPEFRKIRKNNPNFINLCLNTKLLVDITLQPLKRFDRRKIDYSCSDKKNWDVYHHGVFFWQYISLDLLTIENAKYN